MVRVSCQKKTFSMGNLSLLALYIVWGWMPPPFKGKVRSFLLRNAIAAGISRRRI